MKPREYDFGRHRKIGSFLHKGINPNNRWSTPSHKLRSKEKAYEFLPCSTTNSKEQERERPIWGNSKMGATPKRGADSKRGTGCDVTRKRHRTRHDENVTGHVTKDTSRRCVTETRHAERLARPPGNASEHGASGHGTSRQVRAGTARIPRSADRRTNAGWKKAPGRNQ